MKGRWLGHIDGGGDITSRYSKTLADDVVLPRKLADQIGADFSRVLETP